MLTNIDILGICAVILSNVIAYVSLKRLREKEQRKDQDRMKHNKIFL